MSIVIYSAWAAIPSEANPDDWPATNQPLLQEARLGGAPLAPWKPGMIRFVGENVREA